LKQQTDLDNSSQTVEGIDFEKLAIVFKKNTFWVIFLFVALNLTSILILRYTRDLFESESELKLDLKRDATEFGIKTVIEDQTVNIISGEIEQIKSKLFIRQLIDSMDLKVSYYSLGKLLKDEMYRRSPFTVTINNINPLHYNIPVYFEPLNTDQFEIQFGENGEKISGSFNKPLTWNGTVLEISKTAIYEENDGNDYFFVVNSQSELIRYVSSNLKVDPLNTNANTIRISFKDHNALKAHEIVAKIDSLYIQYSNRQKNLANMQKIEWLNKELVQIEKRIEDFENYFENFTLQNKSSDLTLDLKNTITAINKIDSQRYDLNKRILELNAVMDELQGNQSVSLSYTRSLPDWIRTGLEELQKISFEREKLSLAYNENTFAYRQKNQEYTSIKDNLFSQLLNIKKEWLTQLGDLIKKKERLEKEFIQMPDKNTQYSKNQRFYKLYEEFYLSMMKSKAEFEIAQAGSTPDFKILSPSTLSTIPISPKKNMIIAIGFVAGIVINIFFIGFLYLINNKITSLRELENGTRVPILGAIPITHHSVETIFHVIDNPKSVVSEAIRTLRTNLEFFSTGETNKVISISSTISGEGKSFLAVNLGGVIALSRKKIVLVDLDMRKPKNDKYPAGSDSHKGMSTILIKKNNWKDCLIHTSLENFDFIPSGPHPPNPSELLANEEFTEFLTDLKKYYEYIIIDTPPVGLVTDGVMAMKHSDVSIYVFRANYSNLEFMHNLFRIVTLNKLKNVSAVLNAMPVKSSNYGYGYYEDRTPLKKRWKKIFRLS
jgi:tyrosine-protein kinase Etk/Wzc